MLTTTNHSRDSAGLRYVYPVISRRSGGLSVGVNLNPDNACNWRCVYCQVPDLQRGNAPDTDLALLEKELRGFLDEVTVGDFYLRLEVPADQRVIRDIAISGNGEPTSSRQFDQVVALIGVVAEDYGLLARSDSAPLLSISPLDQAAAEFKLVLISNGSLIRRENVRQGLAQWGTLGGELWFKLDSATEAGIQRINGVHHTPASVLKNLKIAAALCPVWLQTCVFALDGVPPVEAERLAYLDFLRLALGEGVVLRGVLLYGLARPSMQVEAPRLAALSGDWMAAFAAEIEACGVTVRLSP